MGRLSGREARPVGFLFADMCVRAARDCGGWTALVEFRQGKKGLEAGLQPWNWEACRSTLMDSHLLSVSLRLYPCPSSL